MRIRFRNNDYRGANLEEVFNKIWKNRKGKKVYSEDKIEFIKKMFESIAYEASNIGKIGKEYMTSKNKETSEKVNKELEKIEKFLKNIKEGDCLTPKHLIAYAEKSNSMEIKDETKKIREEINQAKEELEN